ncbi:type II/IV secretion system protein [Candidatus Sumerlaeota bacterium]|nr:type II/IV secretion system protein [Candidatus Sumerlaeota bacterium]
MVFGRRKKKQKDQENQSDKQGSGKGPDILPPHQQGAAMRDTFDTLQDWGAPLEDAPPIEPMESGARSKTAKLTPSLGTILEEAGLVSTEMIQSIMNDRVRGEEAGSLKSTLIEKGLVREEDIMDAIAEEMGLVKIELHTLRPSKDLIEAIDVKVAKQYKVFPVRNEEDAIYVALSDPLNVQVQDDLERILQKRVVTMIASEGEIDRAIARYYEKDEILDAIEKVTDKVHEEMGLAGDEWDQKIVIDDDIPAEELPAVVRFIDLIFRMAVHEKASDIHIEPAKNTTNIRFRVDGVLHEIPSPPKRWERSIISRLKVLSRMDLAEKRIPQDGRIKLDITDKNLDLRVSALPTIHGAESVVMRILDQESVLLGLEDVGFLPRNIAIFERLIRTPTGIILMTGPTGSGKTTTLYAALGTLNSPETKLVTIEDPVEYMLEGIIQVQINPAADVTFSTGLRTILRQSPDVILVGEIRDMETAEIAIRAALTGHLVFSTLHTNDAATAPVRLIDMGVKPYLVASSLAAAIAQRLVRRVCSHCKKPYAPTPQELIDMGVDPNEYAEHEFFHGSGCERCGQSGYRGRTAIHEIFMPEGETKQMILRSMPGSKIKIKAVEQGMLTLRMDGFEKAKMGTTTLTEVIRITGMDEAE